MKQMALTNQLTDNNRVATEKVWKFSTYVLPDLSQMQPDLNYFKIAAIVALLELVMAPYFTRDILSG